MNIKQIQNESLVSFLQLNHAVFKEDVICCTPFDLTNGEFISGYIVLTADTIYISASKLGSTKIFAGSDSLKLNTENHNWTVKQISINDVKELNIQHNISGGSVSAETESLSSRLICTYTGLYSGEIRRFVNIFNKIKKKEKPDPQDFIDENERGYCPKCGSSYPDQGRKVCPKCLNKVAVFKRIFKFFSKYKFSVLGVALFGTLGTLMALTWPYLNGNVLYTKVFSGDVGFMNALGLKGDNLMSLLIWLFITMLTTKLLQQFFGILQGLLSARIVSLAVGNIREQVFNSLGHLSVKFFSDKQTGSLMTRVLKDSEEVSNFFIDGLPYLLTNVITLVFSTVLMFVINWRLAIYTGLILPFLSLTGLYLGPKWWDLIWKMRGAERNLSAQANDNLTGARVVKSFGQQKGEIKRFSKYNRQFRESEVEVVKFQSLISFLFGSLFNFSMVVVWGVGAYFILGPQQMPFGVTVAFVGYLMLMAGPLDFLTFIFHWWASTMSSASRIFEILDAKPNIIESDNPMELSKINGSLEVENLSFFYEPGKDILKEISFSVDKGTMIGIVGRSGVGKSTLVNLISRLYDPIYGDIKIDGVNLKDLSMNSLHRAIAMVSQDTTIFMGTVAENIAYARPEATRDEIIKAAKNASAHDFISKMTDGYDTLIGTGGAGLSGGERQRLSLARAILLDPPILILDEATASVDTKTEQVITGALKQITQNRTTLSIAHRLSTLKHAAKILVLEHGKIKEFGTHQQLIDKKGTYAELVDIQNKALSSIAIAE